MTYSYDRRAPLRYSYDRRARELAPVKVLEYVKMEGPGSEAEFWLVERLGMFYTLYFSGGGNLSLGIEARAKSKGKAKSDYDRLVKKALKGVQKMGLLEHEITSTRMDSDAKSHLKAFDSDFFGVDWGGEVEELGSPQEDFLPYMRHQMDDWKGTSNQLSATRHEYWPEFHEMVVKAVKKKYGSSITLYRGIYRDQAKEILESPKAPIDLRTYSSFADSLDGAKAYRRLGSKEYWVVIKAVFRPKDIALAPVLLPDFIEPKILLRLASDVQHSGDELVVGPRRKLTKYRVVLKTKKPL